MTVEVSLAEYGESLCSGAIRGSYSDIRPGGGWGCKGWDVAAVDVEEHS